MALVLVLFFSHSDARLSITQFFSKNEEKTSTKYSVSGWKCKNCYDSNEFVLSNGKEILESEHKLQSSLIVHIKFDFTYYSSNPITIK